MVQTWMLRDGQILEVNSLSELGQYSCLFLDASKRDSDDDILLLNEKFGTLMRTKGSHSNEGGVNAGYSVIDTPILFAAEQMKEQFPANVETLPE